MVDIPGLPTPDAGPVFDLALLVHIAAGLVAVASGLLAMLTRKGGPWHIATGRIFAVGIVALFATMLVMTVIRWPATVHLAILGAVALVAATLGWRNRRRHGNDTVHIACWAPPTSRCSPRSTSTTDHTYRSGEGLLHDSVTVG
ncbi:hypothetical protein L603_002800000620 [Cellulosimicrobium cellulans J34]|nr:hypothetical protein L603_002800000620 [Cellulosimicrobium cellulans J34]SMF13555.1 hypothetical protein SAMN02744115_01624 [Cellulosimicrobium cellulans J1]